MTWSDFYLLCFLVGFSLSVLSFLAGAVHIHLPFKRGGSQEPLRCVGAGLQPVRVL